MNRFEVHRQTKFIFKRLLTQMTKMILESPPFLQLTMLCIEVQSKPELSREDAGANGTLYVAPVVVEAFRVEVQ